METRSRARPRSTPSACSPAASTGSSQGCSSSPKHSQARMMLEGRKRSPQPVARFRASQGRSASRPGGSSVDQIRARARSSVVVSADLHRARSTPGWPGAWLFGHYEKVALMSCQVGALCLAPAIRGCLPGRLEADVLVGEISERDPSIRAAARFRVACAMSRPTRPKPSVRPW